MFEMDLKSRCKVFFIPQDTKGKESLDALYEALCRLVEDEIEAPEDERNIPRLYAARRWLHTLGYVAPQKWASEMGYKNPIGERILMPVPDLVN
jgi:hypothetical protein